MSFTSIEAVVAHYPGFEHCAPDHRPPEAQIKAYIACEQQRLTAILKARGYLLEGLGATNPAAYALLSLANQIGAAALLGEDLIFLLGSETFPGDWANPASLWRSYENMLAELGRGIYDRLFDVIPK